MQLVQPDTAAFEHTPIATPAIDFPNDEASAVIGPEGGTVAVTNPASPLYGSSLQVPAGALNTTVRVSLQQGTHACAFGLGPSIELLPCGLQFNRPATLTMRIGGSCAGGPFDFETPAPAVYHYDETIEQWTCDEAAVPERQGNIVRCDLHHL